MQAEEVGIKAIFNKDDIDTQKLWRIDSVKTNFMLGFGDLDVKSAGSQLTNLLMAELSIMTKYFSEAEIRKKKVIIGTAGEKDFYQLKELSSINYDEDLEEIGLIVEKTGEIYDYFARQIGNELPMGKTDFLER